MPKKEEDGVLVGRGILKHERIQDRGSDSIEQQNETCPALQAKVRNPKKKSRVQRNPCSMLIIFQSFFSR